MTWAIHEGDCREILPGIPDGSVDAVISDPPYAEIDRDYGRLTETEWHDLMDSVVRHSLRVLRPHGSAVFIIQPNSARLGRMRPWAFEFMARAAREWGMVQDAYWWNVSAAPTVHVQRTVGLLRPSAKLCVWVGPENCYRHQNEVLLAPSVSLKAVDRADRVMHRSPSGMGVRRGRMAAAVDERGGATPFNVIPFANTDSVTSAGSESHGAGTPAALCSWWVRYICPPGGVVLDPFAGTSTVGVEALKHARSFIGIEKMARWCGASRRRLADAGRQPSLFDPRRDAANPHRKENETK